MKEERGTRPELEKSNSGGHCSVAMPEFRGRLRTAVVDPAAGTKDTEKNRQTLGR